MQDVHCSFGPVSSMPGSQHLLPQGAKCDSHSDRDAVARVQGETDSFGCEYVLMCAECRDGFRLAQQEEYEQERYCDWCGQLKKHCKPHRDMDEGMSGPMYQVCGDCRARESDALAQELEESREMYGFSSRFDDYFDDDDFEPPEQDLGKEPLRYEQVRYRIRYAGTNKYVMARDAQTYLEILGRRVAERWLAKHKHRVRGRKVVLHPTSFH